MKKLLTLMTILAALSTPAMADDSDPRVGETDNTPQGASLCREENPKSEAAVKAAEEKKETQSAENQ